MLLLKDSILKIPKGEGNATIVAKPEESQENWLWRTTKARLNWISRVSRTLSFKKVIYIFKGYKEPSRCTIPPPNTLSSSSSVSLILSLYVLCRDTKTSFLSNCNNFISSCCCLELLMQYFDHVNLFLECLEFFPRHQNCGLYRCYSNGITQCL